MKKYFFAIVWEVLSTTIENRTYSVTDSYLFEDEEKAAEYAMKQIAQKVKMCSSEKIVGYRTKMLIFEGK